MRRKIARLLSSIEDKTTEKPELNLVAIESSENLITKVIDEGNLVKPKL